ncbi:MAG: alcohol dehydrogenase catalytic domain-containing protein [Chloroflexi bacterium]|nr:alcohol dehydrogenase catalytic domain-containing protein [Chloroflexota bacterium]
MRALRFAAPRQVACIEVPEPTPGPREVLVRIEACGVCGSDLNVWRGVPGVEFPLSPGAPGHETCGRIVGLGPEVTSLSIGQRVTGLMWNGFAELGTALAEELVPIPAEFGPDPLLGEPLACAMHVIHRAGIRPGDRVALVGFGYLAALIAHLLPDMVGDWIAVARRAESRALATRLGAGAVYDFSSIPDTAWDSFPIVVEAAGVQQSLDVATWLTAYGGRLVIAGYHADGPRTVNMQSWNWKGIDVVNAHTRQPGVHVAALLGAFEILRCRPLPLLLCHTWQLPEAADAFVAADAHPAGFIKALVRP